MGRAALLLVDRDFLFAEDIQERRTMSSLVKLTMKQGAAALDDFLSEWDTLTQRLASTPSAPSATYFLSMLEDKLRSFKPLEATFAAWRHAGPSHRPGSYEQLLASVADES